jgi:hypothetical protein
MKAMGEDERTGARPGERAPRKAVPPCVGPGMVVRRVIAPSADVVFIKGILEALEGVAQVFAERGGELTIAAPADRARELDAVVDDLCAELGLLSATPRAEPVT